MRKAIRNGFTLIEMVIVLAIASILATAHKASEMGMTF
jgi:prepilin-type N-terminal cleavage/methylation domain-containing protein